jgi:CheY-like chemotaxis protein
VCRTIRSDPKFESTRVIIVSGVVNREEIDELLQAGADEFIRKPFNLEQLIGKMTELLAV